MFKNLMLIIIVFLLCIILHKITSNPTQIYTLDQIENISLEEIKE